MGRFTPAWASVLLAACVVLGLAFVAPPQRTQSSTGLVAARSVSLTKPVVSPVSPAPASGSGRTAVAPRATRHRACRAGLIAMTFDDGPNPAVTGQLVRTLVKLKVPATFFMMGEHVDAHPELARLVQRNGFTIGNHTWSHPVLTELSDQQIHHQLRATRAVFRHHHLTVSHLMRPPYGAINARVRRDVRGARMVPVLWNIDSRDWAGGGSWTIAQRILGALRPHRANLVLQHDGVDNSPASAAAVPIVVKRARARGYCFTHLRWNGAVGASAPPRAVTPVGRLRSTVFSARSVPVRAAQRPTKATARAGRPTRVGLLLAELPLRLR